jgi:hypothetical protein
MSCLLQSQRIVLSWWFLLGPLTSTDLEQVSALEKVNVMALEDHMVRCEATAQQLRCSHITTIC